ncbi:MAG: hypothetical protein ACE366_25100 [Bradymonadia bacterium]
MKLLAMMIAAALMLPMIGCGSAPKQMDKESIRDNADAADRDIDRESDRNKEEM